MSDDGVTAVVVFVETVRPICAAFAIGGTTVGLTGSKFVFVVRLCSDGVRFVTIDRVALAFSSGLRSTDRSVFVVVVSEHFRTSATATGVALARSPLRGTVVELLLTGFRRFASDDCLRVFVAASDAFVRSAGTVTFVVIPLFQPPSTSCRARSHQLRTMPAQKSRDGAASPS